LILASLLLPIPLRPLLSNLRGKRKSGGGGSGRGKKEKKEEEKAKAKDHT
jgi:hypothetical protein